MFVLLVLVWVLKWFCFADYENFYPKDKKEIPKGDEQKSQSKGSVFIEIFRSVVVGIIRYILRGSES